jgi:hypothetical protein
MSFVWRKFETQACPVSGSRTAKWELPIRDWSRGSVVGIAIGCGLDARGIGVLFLAESRIFTSPHRSHRLTQTSIEWERQVLSLGVKLPRHEVDH